MYFEYTRSLLRAVVGFGDENTTLLYMNVVYVAQWIRKIKSIVPMYATSVCVCVCVCVWKRIYGSTHF
jgi:hypothetical protein